MSAYNQRIIDEFRADGGQVGGHFKGATMLLLHTTGAKSGRERINPLMYQKLDGEAVAIFASNNGAHTNPAWYHNLLAKPEVTIEIGTGLRQLRARVAEGQEREEIWDPQKRARSAFADYETMTDRRIPVVILEPRD